MFGNFITFTIFFIQILMSHQSFGTNNIPRVQMHGDVYLIGLFSICLEGAAGNDGKEGQAFNWEDIKETSNSEKPHQNQSASNLRRDALNIYLNFVKTVEAGNYLNDKHNIKSLHFGAVSYDVCNRKKHLMEILLSLVLSPSYFYLTANHQPVSLKYVAVYGYMDNYLTKLAGHILFFSTVPFIAISDQPERMLARKTFPLYNQLGIQKQNAYQLKKMFDLFNWKSIAIINLSSNYKHSERTKDLFDILLESGDFCVYMAGNEQPHNINNTVKMLKNRPDLKIIYAMGDSLSSLTFLNLVDQSNILDRVIFLDKQFITSLKFAPKRLIKGLFLTSSFFDKHIPPFLQFMACNNTWFYQADQQLPEDDRRCQSNPHLLIKDLYDINSAFGKIIKMFNFAVSLPIMLSAQRPQPSSAQHLVSQIQDISYLTYKYFVAGYYLVNLDIHPKPFSIIQLEFKLQSSNFIWSNYLNETPPQSKCTNYRPAPAGMFQTFGLIKNSLTVWENEVGWYYERCPQGTIKENPGNDTCSTCPKYQIPSFDNTQCLDAYISIHIFNSKTIEGVMSLILIILVILISLVFMFFYFFHRNTPVVKSSQLSLTTIQLASHLLIALVSTLGQWLNHSILCMSNAGIIGILITLNLATTIVKTQTVITIFKSRRKISVTSKLRYKQQRYIIITIALSISLLLSVVLMVNDVPKRSTVINHQELTRFRFCDSGNHLQIQYVYTTMLSIICTLQSLRARRLPEYFKSTRFIVYAMYINLVTMIVFFTLFNIQRKNKYLQTYIVMFVTNLDNLCVLMIVHAFRVVSMLDMRRNNQNNLRMLVQKNIKKQQDNHFKHKIELL